MGIYEIFSKFMVPAHICRYMADDSETTTYMINYWADVECFMRDIEAESEEEAIEKAKEHMKQQMYYGDVSNPAGVSECRSFSAREQ